MEHIEKINKGHYVDWFIEGIFEALGDNKSLTKEHLHKVNKLWKRYGCPYSFEGRNKNIKCICNIIKENRSLFPGCTTKVGGKIL